MGIHNSKAGELSAAIDSFAAESKKPVSSSHCNKVSSTSIEINEQLEEFLKSDDLDPPQDDPDLIQDYIQSHLWDIGYLASEKEKIYPLNAEKGYMYILMTYMTSEDLKKSPAILYALFKRVNGKWRSKLVFTETPKLVDWNM